MPVAIEPLRRWRYAASRSGERISTTSNVEEMMQVQWRQPRPGHEREDIERNVALAERLLSDPSVDDFIIALGVLDWRLVGPHGERWPMQARNILIPDWAIGISEQDADVRHYKPSRRLASEIVAR
jgi:hypothetical protein